MNRESGELSINPEYYSDENVEKAFGGARRFLENIFGDTLQPPEYLKLHHIARDIQTKQTMASEDTWGRPMWTEIVYRFVESCYGEDIQNIEDFTGADEEKVKQHLRNKRQEYLEGHL